MARHACPLHRTAQRALIVLATASAAVGAGVAAASADTGAVTRVPVRPTSLDSVRPQAGLAPAGAVRHVGGSARGFRSTLITRTRATPAADGGDLTGLTGPIARTGPIGAVPAAEGLAGVLGSLGLGG
ncbi:hypothetical protein [Streptomyces sp. NPDC046759]|uniref:hypothetical protein n=1 Tax=Streptomyces sp. NPDC046759 TaxID=3155019 RepID=UPI0033D385C3